MSIESLRYRERAAREDPRGALVLWHGRGADENDLFPLLDMLDPDQRLIGATPRGPLMLPPGGAHWYQVRQVGYPDPATFHPTFDRARSWLDAWLEGQGLDHDRLVLGGFSQGAVMTHALTLASGRPRPAGAITFSGFIPTVEGFEIDLSRAQDLPMAVGHGIYDPVISVEWGRDTRDRLTGAGARLAYAEYPLPHAIDPAFIEQVTAWINDVLGLRGMV